LARRDPLGSTAASPPASLLTASRTSLARLASRSVAETLPGTAHGPAELATVLE
jgi:hypothetical protein